MAVWLGYGGGIRLTRAASGPVFASVNEADVDPAAKRLSVDQATAALTTGDRVSITSVDNSGLPSGVKLPFIDGSAWPDGNQYPDGQWYVNVDPMGGVRFFRDWSKCLRGHADEAEQLLKPASTTRVRLALVEGSDHCLGQTTEWELNTNRELADITPLGEGFQKNMGTLVTGSGRLGCLFDAGQSACNGGVGEEDERSIYLHRLVLRQEIGSTFTGVFLLKREDADVVGLADIYSRRALFYTCDCVITGVASQITLDDAIRSQVEFVTTGPIHLVFEVPVSYLMQEGVPSPGKILSEDGGGMLVDLPL